MAALVVVALFCQPKLVPGAEAAKPAFQIFGAERFLAPLQAWNPVRATGAFRSVTFSFANSNEYTPRWVTLGALMSCIVPSDDVLLPKPDAGVIAGGEWAGAEHIHGDISVDAVSFPKAPDTLYELPYIIVHQIYFPGWELRVNGEPVRHVKKYSTWKEKPVLVTDAYGRMQLFFTHPGNYDVELYYAGPPHWLARNMLALFGIMVLCFAAVRCGLVRAEIPFPRQLKKFAVKR
jgi:hypothetical protein